MSRSDIVMLNPSDWSEVVNQLETLSTKKINDDLNNVKKDLIAQLQDATEKSLSFPAACSLIGVSSFIWGVINLNYYGQHLKDYYNPEGLRPLFKQKFFQSLAEHYSKPYMGDKSKKSKVLAFKKIELTQGDFDKRMKQNWKSTLPAMILEKAGVDNITLCTEKFWELEWSQKQSENQLKIVLEQLYHGNRGEHAKIKKMNHQDLKQFFANHLSKGSKSLEKMNSWVDRVIKEEPSSDFPPLPSLQDTNTSDSYRSSEFSQSKRRKLLEENSETSSSDSSDTSSSAANKSDTHRTRKHLIVENGEEPQSNDDTDVNESDEGENALKNAQSGRESSSDPPTTRRSWLDWFERFEENHNFTGDGERQILKTGWTCGWLQVKGAFKKFENGRAYLVQFEADNNKHGLCARSFIRSMLGKALKEAIGPEAETYIMKNIDALDKSVARVHVKRNTTLPVVQKDLTVFTPPVISGTTPVYLVEKTEAFFLPPTEAYRLLPKRVVRKEITSVRERNDAGSKGARKVLEAAAYNFKVLGDGKSKAKLKVAEPAKTLEMLSKASFDKENQPRFDTPLRDYEFAG